MKWLKRILVGGFALLVALVVAVYAVINSLDVEDLRATIQEQVKAATGRDFTVAGPIDIQVSLQPSIALDDVTLANAPWASETPMIRVKHFEVEVALLPLISGQIDVRNLVLVEPKVLLEIDEQGKGNWQMGDAPAEQSGSGAGKYPLPNIETIRGESGQLVFHSLASGARYSVSFEEVTAEPPDRVDGLVQIATRGALNDVPFTLDGKMTPLAALGSGPFRFDATAEALGAKIAAKGQIAQPAKAKGLDVQVSAKGQSLADLDPAAGGGLPALGPYELSANVVQSGESYEIKGLSAKLADSDLAGNATFAPGAARPKITAELRSSQLDLAQIADAAAQGDAASAEDSAYVFGETPLPIETLKLADAEISLTAAKVKLATGLELQAVNLKAALDRGHLKVKPFKSVLAKGALDLDLSFDASQEPPQLALQIEAKDVDYGLMLTQLDVVDGVSGNLDASILFNGSGRSPRELAAGLNGRTEMISYNGQISDELAGVMATGLWQILSPFSKKTDYIPVNCAVSRFDVKQGLATSTALLMDTPTLVLVGSGTVDLKTEKLDLVFETDSKDVSLASFAADFHVRGTLAEPTASPDPLGIVKGAASIAGSVIMPLHTVAALLTEDRLTGLDNKVRCVKALEEADQEAGGKADKSVVEEAADEVGDTLKDLGEGISEGLDDLLGN
ncbi:MAG: AsmA family protein [Pseudomonadota bacterium]